MEVDWGQVWNGALAAAYGELRQAAGARVSPSGSPVEWVITPAADNILSGVHATLVQADRVDQVIDDVVGVFAESPAGGLWLLGGGDQPADLAGRLEARGLYVGGSGMSATADALLAPPPPLGFRVSEVTAADEVREWETVAAAVWADNPKVASSMAKVFASIRLGETSAVRLFVGWCDQRPVAMSTAFVSDDAVNVEYVGVVPEYRRRGFGAAISWAPLAATARRYAVIGPDDDSWRLYQKLGFRFYEPTRPRFAVLRPATR